jgi:hypothetical protein
VELNFERGRKQGLLDAKKEIETSAKELGLSDKTMNIIRARFVGLEDKK